MLIRVQFERTRLGVRGGGKVGAVVLDGLGEFRAAMQRAYARAGVDYDNTAIRQVLDAIPADTDVYEATLGPDTLLFTGPRLAHITRAPDESKPHYGYAI